MRSCFLPHRACSAVSYPVGWGRMLCAPDVPAGGNTFVSKADRGRWLRVSTSVRALALASLCALAGGLLFVGAPARAAVTHNYLSRIAEVPAEGPKGEAVPLPGPLSEPGAMTVDSGDLWVAEHVQGTVNFRVDEFNASSGAFVSQLAQPGPSLNYADAGIAVGHATGEAELYVSADVRPEGGPEEGAVAVYDAAGGLQAVWNGADTPNKAFGCFFCTDRGGVAVDGSASLGDWAAGDVYVSASHQEVVDVFKPEAGGKEKYVTQLTGPEAGVPFSELGGVAVSAVNGDVLVADGSAVDVFEPTALNEYALVRRLTGTPAGSFESSRVGVAVDGANGDIYVTEGKGRIVDQFNSEGVYLGHLTGVGTPAGAFGGTRGVAVDPATHDVYVGDRNGEGGFVDAFGPSIVVPDVTTEPASNLTARSVTLNGAVNPRKAGAATCQFVWGTSTSFGEVAPCPAPVAEGEGNVPVSAALTGLQPDTTYHYRLQAGNANGINPGEAFQDQEFTTPGPGIHGESASIVTSVSATLNAAIDAHNAPTTYYFQYGTSAAYGTSVPAPPGVGIGSGEGDLSVSVHLQGLEAGTVYHYRVVAIGEPSGEVVTVEGPDETFTTQAAGTLVTQPDGRQWELVSPPDKQGAAIIAVGTREEGDDIQAAQAGGGITYGATAPFVANPAGSNSPEVTQVISVRTAPGIWKTEDITTAHNEGATEFAVGHSAEYKLFSSDLSLGLVEPMGHTPLPPLPSGSEKTIYLREAGGGYDALVTSANVPSGCKFGGEEGAGGVYFVNGTPDMSHVIVGTNQFAAGPVCLSPGVYGGLYEWSKGKLDLVSELPSREAVEGTLAGVRHAISNDGARVAWFPGYIGHTLYLRDMTRGETVPVGKGVTFQTADTEGSKLFFTSGGSLNVFEVTSGKGEPLAGKSTKLTASGGVYGVIGASEDGSYIYFVDSGILGDGAEHGAENGGPNLYVEHYDREAKAWSPPKLIAVLSEDGPSWGSGETNLDAMTSRVSPNGRYLAFMSEKSLTGYENRDANSGARDEEVFLYDANTGHLVCTSCNPTGARPVGLFRKAGLIGLWNNRWLAGNIPGWTTTHIGTSLSQSRYLSNSGRLFFNNSDALVPADVNGKEDVYEYEPVGVGSCKPPGYGQSASDVFVASIGGCVALISAGTSSEESAFMDASETGGDVFFLTLSRLSPRDFDTSIDLYDAHECRASSPCAPAAAVVPPPCTTGDACKPAPSPQPAIFGAPASATFSGAGNVVPSASESSVASRSLMRAQKLAKALKVCRSKPKRRRAACESRARKRYGTKRSRAGKSLSSGTRR